MDDQVNNPARAYTRYERAALAMANAMREWADLKPIKLEDLTDADRRHWVSLAIVGLAAADGESRDRREDDLNELIESLLPYARQLLPSEAYRFAEKFLKRR